MGNYKEYAEKLDALATEFFETRRKAQVRFDAAKREYNLPSNQKPKAGVWMATPAEVARISAIESEYEVSKAELRDMNTQTAENIQRTIKELRGELEQRVSADFVADPAQIDNNTMVLLASGILSADEYANLMAKAGEAKNHTMVRLIANAALNAYNTYSGDNAIERGKLAGVVRDSSGYGGDAILAAFDAAATVFNYGVKTPPIGDSWAEYSAKSLDVLRGI